MSEEPKSNGHADLLTLHMKRAEELFRLSLAAAYGSLFFLLQLEKLVPLESRNNGNLLHIAWTLSWISILAGTIQLVVDTIAPLADIGTVGNLSRKIAAGDFVSERDIDALLERNVLWNIPH